MKKNYKILADCREMYEEDVVTTILDNRGINDVEHFLNPTKEDMLPLDSLKNIDKAYALYKDAIDNNKKIVVYADTDVDGITSGTIITRYTKEIQEYNCDCIINKGKAHGLNGQNLERLRGTQLLIIVDSLDSTVDNYIKLKTLYDVENIIVLDHHNIKSDIEYDKYITLVSSQRDYNNPGLSGAGVCYKFICYCEDQESIDLSNAEKYSDLCACGLLADVMPVGEDNKENRYLVNLGLNNLNNPAIKKILGSYDFNSKAVLFSIAPLVNAAVRVGESDVALELFLEDDNKAILALKKEVEKCKERQNEEKERLLPLVRQQLDAQNNILKAAIINTEYGVSGLIGNTVLEEYKCPILILNEVDNKYMGSMRSIGYGNMAKLINECGGTCNGHEEAAGFEIYKDEFELFMFAINETLKNIKFNADKEEIIDCEINYTDITRTLINQLAKINYISGNEFKPIKVKVVGMTEYNINSWKQGKHILFQNDNGLSFIEWNTSADFDEMEDKALMGEEIIGIGELDAGFVGRNYMMKLILSDYWFK